MLRYSHAMPWWRFGECSYSPTHSDVYLKECSRVKLVTVSLSLFFIFVAVLGLQVSNSSVTSLFPLPLPTTFRAFLFLFSPPCCQLNIPTSHMLSPTHKTQAYRCYLFFILSRIICVTTIFLLRLLHLLFWIFRITIQIIQPTRCNSFTSFLLDVYVWLNMFRASPRPSSGAYNCTRSLWFYRWREAAAWALLVVVWQTTTNNAPAASLQR